MFNSLDYFSFINFNLEFIDFNQINQRVYYSSLINLYFVINYQAKELVKQLTYLTTIIIKVIKNLTNSIINFHFNLSFVNFNFKVINFITYLN